MLPRDLDEEDAPLDAPRVIGPFVLSAEVVDAPGLVCLLPGEAFGGGRHPTTRLLLEAIGEDVRPGARVLDVGTGSGVLALSAARRGADAVGIDRDPRAVAAAERNREASGIRGGVAASQHHMSAMQHFDPAMQHRSAAGSAAFRLGEARDVGGTFDRVIANLPARAIVESARALAGAVAPGAALFVSGALLVEAGAVTRALEAAGLRLVERAAQAGWARLRFARQDR